MDEERQARADALLQEALDARGLRDPRGPLRNLLRALRETPLFRELVRRYEDELVPGIAAGAVDPVGGWEDFGRALAAAAAPGREVAVDPGGRAAPAEGGCGDDRLILYLPDEAREPATPLRAPRELTPPQEATLALLVEGRLRV